MTNIENNYQKIIKIVSKEIRRKIIRQVSKSLFYLAGLVGFCMFFSSLLDIVFEFDPPVRSGIIVGTVIFSGSLFVMFVLFPLIDFFAERKKYSIETIAREIGDKHEELHDDLLNSLQVYKTSRENKEFYSKDLAAFSVLSVLNVLKGLQVSKLYSGSSIKKALRFFITPLFFALLAIGIIPSEFQGSLRHMLNPTTQFKPTPVKAIIVKPGDVTKVEGDSCDILVQIEGVYSGPIALSLKEGNRELSYTKNINPGKNGIYQYTVKNLRVPINYFVKADNRTSDTYSIKVEKRPFVRTLKARLDFPQYTQLPFRYLEDNVGDVTALKGTRVKLQISSNKALTTARIKFRNGKTTRMKISGDNATTEFVLREEGSYKIELKDQFGYLNLNPIEYTIRIFDDSYPIVDIISPGKDVDLSEVMKLPLIIEAEDDFGFSLLQLGYKIESGSPFPGFMDTTYSYIKLLADGKPDTKLRFEYLWDMVELRMLPEDIVYYFAEVWDNDRVSGPKRSISKVYTARFPSVYEIFAEVARGDEENINKLEEVLSDSKDLKDRLDNISRELAQQQKMDWLKKQDIEEVAQKQKELQKSVDEVRKELEQMVERMEQNQMLSLETLKKFQELQQLFSEIMTPELQKAMEELRKAADELNESKLKQALNKLQISQENLLKNLERTINLLKRLQLEERIDQATKLTENLSERQQALNEQIKNNSPEDIAKMLHQQQKLEQDAKSLDDLLSQLDQNLEQNAQFRSETMDSLLNEIQNVMQQMQNAQQNMQQGKMQQAERSGQMSEQNLQAMLQQLKQLKKSFIQQQKQEFAEQFSKSSNKLLRLSKDQESLMKKTKTLSPASPQMGEMADNQLQQHQHLGRITDQLYALSQKTFFVSPEIGRAIGKAMLAMQRALRQIEQRNSKAASGQQARALGGLNEAIMNIQEAMQKMQSSASSSGFEEFMKRMEQMTGKQQGLNQQTLQMGKQKGGQMTLQQQAGMARIAAEQEALRKSMEQLQKEFGNRSEIAGRLDGITKEMEKVVEELEQKRVNPRTLDRQKKILSRMLDAQRSMNKRDYSKQRESRSGETYFVRSPEGIDEKVILQKERFLEDLIRARKVGFNSDYLELIRNYFHALNEK